MNTFEKIRMTLSIMLFVIAILTSVFVWHKLWFDKLFGSVENYILIAVWFLGLWTSIVWITKTIFAKKDEDTHVFMKFGIIWTILFLQVALVLLHFGSKATQ